MARGVTAFRSGRNQGAGKYCLRSGSRGPYRKPTQVGGMRNLRRSRELALRNSAKCTRNFRPRRLFIKNTAICEPAMGRIGGDTCPVPEG